MDVFETVDGVLLVGEKREDGLIYVNGDELVERINGLVAVNADLGQQIKSLTVRVETLMTRNADLQRKISRVQDTVQEMLRDEVFDRETAKQIADAGGFTLRQRKRVTGTHSWSVIVEWDDDNEPDASDVAYGITIDHDEYELEDSSIETYDDDYDV